ncbi:MAG: PilZ domain-containing protein [Pirellulales bacterium]
MRNWIATGRRPRHVPDEEAAIELVLRRAPGERPQVVTADLLDLSRQGTRLRTKAVLGEGEVVTICVRTGELALDLDLTGVVRWRKQEAGGRWSYGCEFKDELSLETLGELFLCGILSAEPPASTG